MDNAPTEPRSPPPIGAVSAGIRYQVRFFWRQALQMLVPNPAVQKVVMEHRGAGAVDDVVVSYEPPGVNDRGATIQADFYQLKFHVAQSGTVDHDSIIDPEWTNTKVAMLPRFAEAWRQLKASYPRLRLNLVTNWPWDPGSPIAPLLRDGGHLGDDFMRNGPRSALGKIRTAWQNACQLSEPDFSTFVRSLRLSTSAISLADAELWLRDKCQLAGLVPIPLGMDHSPYDDLGMRLIESGRTEQTPASLRALVQEQGLVAEDPPYRSTFAVRSFKPFAHVVEADGACVVDLTDLFSLRNPRSEKSWSGEIRERLEAALPRIEALGEPIHVSLDTHLSIAWYAGYLLPPKSGKGVVLRQRILGRGIELWDVSVPKRPEGGEHWKVTVLPQPQGQELAVVISVTHDALTDASRYISESLGTVGRVIHAELPQVGHHAVQDGGHARWLIDELVRAIGAEAAKLRPTRVHVFAACPASLMFLLGQASHVFGSTTVYEFAFGDPARTYRPGMTTGILEHQS